METSCDDTSVAILEKSSTKAGPCYAFHFHEKITANNSAHGGVHPITSLESHQENLATLIAKALKSHNDRPDFVSVTRGPGMRSSLTTGLDTAKGLAVAWHVPLVGVNHMQAHALTPRLVSALSRSDNAGPSHRDQGPEDPSAVWSPDGANPTEPSFPYLSLLVSGGHTLLVHTQTLTSHPILASTSDIAVGDCLDKIARQVLPASLLQGNETMYGRILEGFVFPNGESDYNYTAPCTRAQEIARRDTQWGWTLVPPLAETRSGSKSRSMEFTFSGLGSAVKRICEGKPNMGDDERRHLGRETMRLSFEHLASRVGWALKDLEKNRQSVNTLVVSGGVASNGYLREILRKFLNARGFPHVSLTFPPAALCTDNAAMIAWTGMEMYESGWTSQLSCRALRKWSMDPSAEDGGILGVGGWMRHDRGSLAYSTIS